MLADDISQSPRILVAAGEAFPFAKTGGLADVVGALPAALARAGAQPSVIIPAYREIQRCGLPIVDTDLRFVVPIGNKQVYGGLLISKLPGTDVSIYFVKQDDYYDRPGLYAEKNVAYVDNCERYVFFCRAVLEAIRLLKLEVDVIHANDWHAGLIPALLKLEYRGVPGYERIASAMTIHNIQYQGDFWHWDMLLTGLDWRYFNWRQMEAFGKLNLLKTGLAFADVINTVSPRYAAEIQTPDFSCGLEGVLRHRSDVLAGIVNGVDYEVWNPATDKHLIANYTPATVRQGKAANKAALQKQTGLALRGDVPLVGFIGRLVEQKGVDLILDVLEEWVRDADVQWVFLAGDGDPALEQRIVQAAAAYPDKVAAVRGYNEATSHLIEAGADIFLMPSRFEPCGLNQLYSLKYGTIPVVHLVGGLADTVVDADPETLAAQTATGFAFVGANSHRLGEALARACETYRSQPQVWNQLQQTGMQQDWSWDRSAGDYLQLYRHAYYLAHRHDVVGT